MQIPPSIQKLSIAQYLILIEPRKDLCDTILGIKAQFNTKYKLAGVVRGKPHITLVNFVQYTTFEDRIRQKLRSLSLSRAPFQVDLLDYGSFPSHTIFINVLSRPAIQSLVKLIRTESQTLMKPDNEHRPHFIMEPHVTIARRLKPWQYEQGWLEYSNRNFSGKFIANNMLLLKKEEDAERYEPVERFEFQDIPQLARQSTLF